jgi:diacylglycerol kinase family enzyme
MGMARASSLLILSAAAGNMNPEVEAKLRAQFADHLIIPFDEKRDFQELITPRARIVIAGGDGSVGFVVRKLADTEHPIGIISLGTFNNFALALGLHADIDEQIQIVRNGAPRRITVGRVNGTVFLEACAIGLFGEAIALGQDMKDLEYGRLADDLANVVTAKPFRYELEGDLDGDGMAMSLVFTNTPSFGAGLPVGKATPAEPYLEFAIHAGSTHADIAARAVASALLMKHKEEGEGMVSRFQKLSVRTTPRVRVYADNMLVGRTPAMITAEVSAVKVLLP